ncbi:MAG: aldehyde dehydrogenase family protein [Neisseria sp.]|nr:aldehyde dehydrogenase family protein [Neisseria sp.]
MTTPSYPETDAAAVADIYLRARRAAERLAETNLRERLHAVEKLIGYIREHKEEIVTELCAATRKTRTDGMVSEIMGVLDNFENLIKTAPKILKDRKVATPLALLGKKSRIYHEPLGVVLVIAPWNYPLHIGMTSIMAGFVTGNAVIFKPSEITPMTGLFERILAASPLIAQSAFICYGTGETAQRLIAQRPAKIFFTGSARTGKRILAQAAELLIPVDLELGGKDPAIVFADANLDRAAAGIAWGGLTNAGQSCSSVERIYVQEKVYDAFLVKLTAHVESLVLNHGDSGNADVGGMTADFQRQLVADHVADARAKGATVHTGGEVLAADPHIFQPTVLSGITPDMALAQNETFGPLLPVEKFGSEEEAIALANNTPFGLSASVWGGDAAQLERVVRRLHCGAVSVNNAMVTEGNPNLTFGGTKDSGYGRQKGEEGLLGYTRSKAVMYDSNSSKIEANWYPYTQKKYDLFIRLIDVLFTPAGLPVKLARLIGIGTKLESEAKKPRGS